jgi:uncharacterized protein (TIGR02996 family)
MTDLGEALFRAVCEQPWDDAPRLIYADWLDEHGQSEQAAFIRFQCQYPEWNTSHPQYACLAARDREFDPFKPRWAGELPALPGVKWWSDYFRRGFITTAEFGSAKAFREQAGATFAASPVDSVTVRRVTNRTARHVLASPLLGRLKQLSLLGVLTDEGAQLVAACPTLGRLQALCVWGGDVGDEGAEALAGSPRLSALRCLSFSGHRIGDRGAAALAESQNLSGLTDLVLHGTRGLSGRVVRRLKKRFRRLD